MYLLKLYFVKILKKLNLLWRFNFTLTKTINNSKVKIPFINGSGLVNFILKKDWLDLFILQFIKSNNETFIDVGINVGQTLLKLKTIKPNVRYLGFEPNSACTSYVQQLVKLNGFSDCTIQNCALSDEVQTLILEKTFVDDVRASVVKTLRPGFFSEKEFVLSLDYDSFYLDSKITFVKIDVEGGELEVLKGMKKTIIKHQPLIFCEVLDSHDQSVYEFTQSRASQLTELLHSINYSIIQLETSEGKQKLVSFKKNDSIHIKQWTTDSYNLNDYLFYPAKNKQDVLKSLEILKALK